MKAELRQVTIKTTMQYILSRNEVNLCIEALEDCANRLCEDINYGDLDPEQVTVYTKRVEHMSSLAGEMREALYK